MPWPGPRRRGGHGAGGDTAREGVGLVRRTGGRFEEPAASSGCGQSGPDPRVRPGGSRDRNRAEQRVLAGAGRRLQRVLVDAVCQTRCRVYAAGESPILHPRSATRVEHWNNGFQQGARPPERCWAARSLRLSPSFGRIIREPSGVRRSAATGIGRLPGRSGQRKFLGFFLKAGLCARRGPQPGWRSRRSQDGRGAELVGKLIRDACPRSPRLPTKG